MTLDDAGTVHRGMTTVFVHSPTGTATGTRTAAAKGERRVMSPYIIEHDARGQGGKHRWLGNVNQMCMNLIMSAIEGWMACTQG